MDPKSLIDTSLSSGVPAPLWFVELFKVLGFTLHAVPMNLWYAGILLAMLLTVRGGEHGRRFSSRLMSQMPIFVAFGVNLGIVPLLFVQTAYAEVFYPATILMAWFWLAIVVMLIPAYYGVYVYAFGLRDEGRGMTPWKHAAGWAAAALFIAIGFLFANGFSLMANVGAWPEIWAENNAAGAALGTGLNTGDPSLLPRWLMMFGLAMTTTAVWIVVDAGWFAGRESGEYKQWARGFAWKLYTAGLIWFAVFGSWYTFGTWATDVRETMLTGPLAALTALTALAPGLPWLLLLVGRRGHGGITRGAAALVGLAQFGVLGINAVSRQVVQNVELRGHFDVFAQAEAVQWSPLALFLVTFATGLAVVGWMVAQAVKASAMAAP